MGRNTSPDPVREFLDRLADGIEALGQAEAAEVLNELRGHLDEAMAEAPGDDAGALAAFGNPERLAARILEERGVISGPTAIRPAPAWTRQTARVLDLLTWVAGFLFFGLIPLTVVFWQHTTLAGLYPLWIVGFWLLFSGVAACAGWWSAHRRQSNQRTSLGMRALGLRLVSMGDDRRLVKVKDLPGQPRGAKSRFSASSFS
jgi:uncharacterized membrane protein